MLAAVAALSLSPRAGEAQTLGRVGARVPATADSSSGAGTDAELGSSVVTRARPASFQVVSVPLPPTFAGAAPVRFEVLGTGLGTIVGRRSGVVDGSSLLVTVGVPRDARAGLRTYAHVRLTAPGVRSIEIPLELDVDVVRRIALGVPRAQQGAAAGARLHLAYRVTNEGNATDSVLVDVVLPDGWRRLDKPRPLAIAPGTGEERTMRLALAPSSATGTVRVDLIASSAGEERARLPALVEVADPNVSGRRPGPRVTTGIASVWNGGSSTTVAGVDVSGQLSDSVSVLGRFVSDFAPEPEALRGLARVGYGGTPWFLSLDAPSWHTDFGNVRIGFTPLTGETATGTGASGSARAGPWLVGAFGAGAAPGLRDGSAEFLGLRLVRMLDSVRVGAAVTHLEERAAFGRQLGAFGLDAEGPAAFGTRAHGELAYRRHANGSGVGWATEVSRLDDLGNHFRVRAAGAPGGSAAFARGTRELSVNALRRLSERTSLGASAWRSDDESAARHRVDIMGWSLAPRLLLGDRATLSLELGGHRFDTRSEAAAFGSAEHRAGLALDGRWRGLHGSTLLQHGVVERSVALEAGAAYETRAHRTLWRGTLSSGGVWGAADLSAQIEQSGAGSGYEPRRNEVQLRLQSPVYAAGPTDVVLRGEAHHYGWFGDRASIAVFRAAADVILPWKLRLTVDTERNPLFASLGAGSPWSSALRLSHSTSLPRCFVEKAATGTVYQDLNGDGRRNAGEPGLESAIVRYGSSYGPTDGRGRFSFETPQAGAPRLDVRSVPLGWIVTGTSQEGDGRHTEIGVAPTSSARIQLAVDTAVGGPAPRIALSLIRVSVRAANGREWVAPVDATNAAFFDALPAGRYEIVLDLSRISEPLTTAGGSTFEVGAARGAIERTILVRTRPVRLRRIEAPPPPELGATTLEPPSPGGPTPVSAPHPVIAPAETMRRL